MRQGRVSPKGKPTFSKLKIRKLESVLNYIYYFCDTAKIKITRKISKPRINNVYPWIPK